MASTLNLRAFSFALFNPRKGTPVMPSPFHLILLKKYLSIYVLIFGLMFSSHLMAQEFEVRNGGFEEDTTKPVGWDFAPVNGAETEGSVVTSEKHSGNNSFRISYKAKKEGAYSRIRQMRTDFQVGTKYRVSIWVKGVNANRCKFAIGEKWTTRTNLPEGTFDWQKIDLEYTIGTEDKMFNIVVIVEGPTEALFVDDVQIGKIQ